MQRGLRRWLRGLWRMRRVGVGFRHEIAPWIFSKSSGVEFIEMTAEHFFYNRNLGYLKKIRDQFPVSVHGLSLSLGTPGGLVPTRLREFQNVVKAVDPKWISEHVAFTRSQAADFGHLTPVQYTEDQLKIFIEHAQELMSICQKPLVLENITSHVRIQHDIEEPIFLNELCHRAGCGLLLDVTNLYINSVNNHFDPYSWLSKIKPEHVKQLHVVGFSKHQDVLMDSHSESIHTSPELIQLISHAMNQFSPEVVFIERDEHFPENKCLEEDIKILRAMRSLYELS